MRILSWNIQSGLGCDGRRDIVRIAEYIWTLPKFDIICLQEVSRNIAAYSTEEQEDQLDILCGLFPEYRSFWGPGISFFTKNNNRKEEFGNLTLTLDTPLAGRVHLLPMPPAAGNLQIQRVAVETTLSYKGQELRIINTHLAYHLQKERRIQLEWLTRLQQWAEASHTTPPALGTGAYGHHCCALATLVCGDCNMTPESSDYEYFCSQGWRDCWLEVETTKLQKATCGIFDHDLWPEGPHCRDYFWISRDFPLSVKAITSDQYCDLSDHQPVVLSLQ
jgi:endonuclease/exonuclease/phosphatase family metal-dependent hydrolase